MYRCAEFYTIIWDKMPWVVLSQTLRGFSVRYLLKEAWLFKYFEYNAK